jgi:hypothetical protein
MWRSFSYLPVLLIVLGVSTGHALVVDGDPARETELYRRAAEAGSASDQVALAEAYMAGRGVPVDASEATGWFRRAAEQGHVGAQYRLALAHEMGLGIATDLATAVVWYRQAAEQGHPEAQLHLGLLLSDFPPRPWSDYREALRWLTPAADRNVLKARARLGFIFARGLAGKKNYERAIPLLEEAAQAGINDAHYELGLIYKKGAGHIDFAEARRRFALAAESGFENARPWLTFDPRLRVRHLRNARIFDGPVRVRTPEEIRRGPDAPVRLEPDEDVHCDFYPRRNGGGNPKFRCFMMDGPPPEGSYYDADGGLRPEADGVLILETERGERPVLAAAGVPLTDRRGFAKRDVPPLELKVKYRRLDEPDLQGERDMHTEVAATRLLWALGFPADRKYRVRRLLCHRCPRDPYPAREAAGEGTTTIFDELSIELRYRAGESELYDDWHDGGWSWGEELHRLRYGTAAEGFTREQRKHLDGLIVVMNLVLQLSNQPHQNRLACLRGNIQQLGPYKHCPDTVMLVHDLGATFGKRELDSLDVYRRWPVWSDAGRCEATIPQRLGNEYKIEHFVIGKAGHAFVLELLDQLTDEHLRAVFESAAFERYDRTLDLSDDAAIDAWVAALRDKIEQVRGVTCAGD